jgi:hypothetical protein
MGPVMLKPIAPPDLAPLEASQAYDETEAQIKQLTMDIVEGYLRAYERELNVYGAPHLGSFELIEKSIKADGLAMVRSNSEPAMRYLFKAWRARNPKRGLHFLRMYLALLWPGAATANQLWQQKDQPYPDALVAGDDIIGDPRAGHYLTSRVAVEVNDDNETGEGLQAVRRALRSVLGAKFVLLLRLLRKMRTDLGAFSFYQASQRLHAEGAIAFNTEIRLDDSAANLVSLSETSLIFHATSTV